jgi:hypothetical protein
MATDRYQRYGDVARSAKVRAKLVEVRDRIHARAEAIQAEEGVDVGLAVSEGTRPKGRPYARLSADIDQEFGTENVSRRRILGRAANS